MKMERFFLVIFLSVLCSSAFGVEFSTKLTYDASKTLWNPLRGFMPYTRAAGEPSYSFPHSMEYTYVGLNDLMKGWNSFTFDTFLEPLLNASSARNHTLVVRVYVDYPDNPPTRVPVFLQEGLNFNTYTEHGGGDSPDYFNETLIDAMVQFITAFGANYDGDPRLGFVQVGLLGFWGEWHCYPHDTWFPPIATQSRILDAFVSSFVKTKVLVSQDSLGYSPHFDFSPGAVGLHDDSFAYSTIGSDSWQFVPRLVANDLELLYEDSVIAGEVYPDIQSSIFSSSPSGQDFAECASRTGASWLLNEYPFSPGFSLQSDLNRAKTASLLLGYQLRVIQVTATSGNGTDLDVQVILSNEGNAPFYYPLTMRLSTADGASISSTVSANVKQLQPTKTTTISLPTLIVADPFEPLLLSMRSSYLGDHIPISFANLEVDESGSLEFSLSIFAGGASSVVWSLMAFLLLL